jgi:DNA repair exonuclease SbcCD ATPase subunit
MPEASKSKLGWIVLLGFVALLAAQVYTLRSVRSLEGALAELRTRHEADRRGLDQHIARLEEAGAAAGKQQQELLEALRSELVSARRQAAGAAGAAAKAQQEALRQAETLSARLAANERKIQESQANLDGEITGARQAASAAQSGVTTVSAEVAAVKTEVASTRTQINQTVAELQRTRGDLGELSGLIAANAQQIAALRALGDRDYLEFTLFKSKEPVRVGDISLVLKNADVKNNRYSLDIYVNDVRIEKKDRAVNEPLQFFVGASRQPHELVVNRVAKDQIAGYIASPKAAAPR